jgi:hypothetical protein
VPKYHHVLYLAEIAEENCKGRERERERESPKLARRQGKVERVGCH